MEDQTLHIHMLGEFSLSYAGRTVQDQSNRSRKVWTLLAYLITFRGREVTQAELIDMLWPDESSDNPAGALKTLLHRTRAVLDGLGCADGRHLILRQPGGGYAWNNSVACRIDAEDFAKAYKQAGAARDEEEKLAHYRRAAALYHGDFLARYSAEPWAISINAYYHMTYLQVVHELLALLRERELYEEIVALCSRAVEIEPHDESLYYHQIKALADDGNQQAARSQYEKMSELFFSKFGVTPSDELKALYHEVTRGSNSMESDLRTIRAQLRETALQPGAFYCEYAFFKDVYRIEARSAARSGSAMHLGLLTVSGADGGPLRQRSLNLVMDKLKECTRRSLRRGDVFAKYSVSQYIIMLPHANYENSRLILERIVRSFRRENPHSPARLHYSVQPLEPVS